MFRSFRSLAMLAAVALCAACTTAPTASQVTAIQSACIGDSVIRPIVTGLESLATPAEVAAIDLARQAIDPICANPTAPIGTSEAQAFSESTAQVATILSALQARKKSGATAPPAAASSASSPG